MLVTGAIKTYCQKRVARLLELYPHPRKIVVELEIKNTSTSQSLIAWAFACFSLLDEFHSSIANGYMLPSLLGSFVDP